MHLVALRKDLRFNNDLLNLVDTLKNIAGSQYHQMEKEKERFDRFMDAFSGFFRVVDLVRVENPLVRPLSDVTGIVIVTSDSGFMGGLNNAVIAAGLRAQGDSRASLVVIGEKGAGVLSDQGRDFTFFRGIGQDTIYNQAVAVKDYLVQQVLKQEMGRVLVVHPVALSFSSQAIRVVNLLPCAELFDREAESEVSRRVGPRALLSDVSGVIVESSFADMVEYLASVWVTSKLYEIFEDSKLAEFSARAMHLEQSHQKVEKVHKKLRQMCFKVAHAQIDKGMRESFAAKATSKKKERK